jgi:hypothetical protein
MNPILRFVVAVAFLLGVLVVADPARAHGAAVSRFVVSIGERELAVRANLHLESVLGLVEGSPELAHTGEGQAAIERHKLRVLSYLREHLEFRSEGTLCVPREPDAYGIAEGALYVSVDLTFDCPKPTSGLSVTSTLFEAMEEPHHIEGEFHAAGLRRVYQLSKIRSSVAIDPSSFHDKPYRGQYIPALGGAAEPPRETNELTPKRDAAPAVEMRETEPAASRAVERMDHGAASNRDDVAPRGFINRVGWYAAALALMAATWHVQRTLRKRRSVQSERGRSKGRRNVSTPPAPVSPDDSNQAVSG